MFVVSLALVLLADRFLLRWVPVLTRWYGARG